MVIVGGGWAGLGWYVWYDVAICEGWRSKKQEGKEGEGDRSK